MVKPCDGRNILLYNIKVSKIKVHKKGGRPVKEDIKKRRYRVNLMLNTEEYLTLASKSTEACLSFKDYLRSIIPKAEIRQHLSTETMGLIRQLAGMANNLNQIAHRANAAGYRDARTEYLFLAEKIDNLLNELEK